MSAVGYRLRSQLRARWAGTAALTLVATVICGIVILFATGASRTTSVPQRYAASVGGAFDAIVTQEQAGRPRTAELLSLPAVETADSYTFLFGGLMRPGTEQPQDALAFTGTTEALGVRLISGRQPDPTVEGEFLATRTFMETGRVELGDEFTLVTYTQQQAAAGEFGGDEAPAGPAVAATLVGVVDGPALIEDPTPMVLFSPALIARVDDGMGIALSMTAIRLVDGSQTDDLRAQLDTLPANTGLSIESGDFVSPPMRRAISTQGRGTWILAIVAGIAGVAVLGQLVTRQVRLSSSERQQLTALGYTERQSFAESIALAGVPIVVGCLAGAAWAVAGSAVFPTGFVGEIEPNKGVLIMWSTLVAAAVLMIVGLLVWTVAALLLGQRLRSPGSSPMLESVTTRAPSPTAAVGAHFAFTRTAGERGSVRAALAGLLLTVCGLVAAATFGFSLDRLLDEPFRYGMSYEYVIGDNGGEELADDVAAALDGDPNVISLAHFAQTYARSGSTTVSMLGMRPLRGDAEPTVVAGRLAAAPDEIALGRVTAEDLGATIGDDVELTGPAGDVSYHVVGVVVVPGFGSNEGVGEGAMTTLDGLAAADPGVRVTSAAVRFAPGTNGIVRYAELFGGGAPEDPYVPSAIASVARVRTIPFVLAAVLGLLATLTIAHGMITALRARRHDLAVLRSLGADRRFVARVVHWQATAFSFLPLVVGVPMGFIIGRMIFAAYARNMGAVDTATLPLDTVAAVVVGVVALANLVAILPARTARRTAPAAVLTKE